MKSTCLAFLLALGVTSVAFAQGPNTSVGADVIVGAITGPQNYPNDGTHDAFTIGTTSCNIGSVPLLWVANTNDHPVIGQNMFRLHDGRFEQIGQAWLKHGFLALAGTTCGGPCLGPGGAQLDPGCSDPYGAGLNGQQDGLGPKWEVNASTGIFPYPYTESSMGTFGDSRYKRVRVALADLDPATYPGASYIAEAQYVANDDSAAGNGDNNNSWRACNIVPSGTGYTMQLTGPTMRQEAAIQSWAAADPTVQISSVDIMNDGRVWFAMRTSALPNGNYQWEFAVQNTTSHRSGQAFHVGVAPGTTVTNVGFHDVDYHSGEPFSGTDWSNAVANDTVSWSTQTFAQDPNANALRWGTLYNFRFETDTAPPNSVTMTLDLFRPGNAGDPNSISTSLTPPPTLSFASTGVQGTNQGETFNSPLAVNVATGNGPVVGEMIQFTVLSGPVTLSANSVATDTNGNAQVTATADAGQNGPAIVRAELPSGAFVDFELNVREFNASYIGALDFLVLSWATEAASVPVILCLDAPGQPVIPTPFGDICTTILNPGPTFFMSTGDPALPNYDPQMQTTPAGLLVRNYTGLGLAGSGISVVFQPLLAFTNSAGQVDIAIGECNTVTF